LTLPVITAGPNTWVRKQDESIRSSLLRRHITGRSLRSRKSAVIFLLRPSLIYSGAEQRIRALRLARLRPRSQVRPPRNHPSARDRLPSAASCRSTSRPREDYPLVRLWLTIWHGPVHPRPRSQPIPGSRLMQGSIWSIWTGQTRRKCGRHHTPATDQC
jgi:hypothetical protein